MTNSPFERLEVESQALLNPSTATLRSLIAVRV